MTPIQITVPIVRASGNRCGWNLIVTGVKPDDTFQGEQVAGGAVIEMLPGDLLLSVKPVGNPRDNVKNAALFFVHEQNRRLELLMVSEWKPETMVRLARRARAFIVNRGPQNGGKLPNAKAKPPATSSRVPGISGPEEELRQAVSKALGDGVPPHRVLAIAAQTA